MQYYNANTCLYGQNIVAIIKTQCLIRKQNGMCKNSGFTSYIWPCIVYVALWNIIQELLCRIIFFVLFMGLPFHSYCLASN